MLRGFMGSPSHDCASAPKRKRRQKNPIKHGLRSDGWAFHSATAQRWQIDTTICSEIVMLRDMPIFAAWIGGE
jgi:hypothetical protein